MPVDKTPKRKRRSASFTAGDSETVKTPKIGKREVKKAPTTPKSMQKSIGKKPKTPITKKEKSESPVRRLRTRKSRSLENLRDGAATNGKKAITPKKTKTSKSIVAKPEPPKKEIEKSPVSVKVKKTKGAPISKKDKKTEVVKSPKKGKKMVEKNGIDDILAPLSIAPEGEWNFSDVEEDENDLEALESLQSKYKVKIKDVRTAIEGVLKLTKEAPKFKNQVFGEQFPVFLQVNAIKTSKNFSKILRIPLTNRILTPDSDICLIVPEVKGLPNKEHEQHVEHYEKILRKANISNIKKIMTFHELRTEYDTFELKNRLVELYDFFLVDGRISGKVVKRCGKIFYKKRKVPTPVKLQATKLKEHFEKVLDKTLMFLHSKGDSSNVQIGHSEMTVESLIQNVYSVLIGLDKEFPGGLANIRNMGVYTHQSMVIPIYESLKSQNAVKVPKIQARKSDYLDFDKKEADLK